MDEQKERQTDVVCYPREVILSILETLNQAVVSLDKIGSCYHDDPNGLSQSISDFIIDWDITNN